MQELKRRLTALKRKKQHVKVLENRIAELHNEIVLASFNGEFQYNKNITIIGGNVEIKAKLLKKYNRRLKLIKLFKR
jgi:hypothetical protein